jgi:pimeloyl-ACP methyl ester carboxylesterase
MPQVDGVAHRFVEVRAGNEPLSVHLAEAGEGPPLLLLHGWPQHWWCWRRVLPRLAARHRLLMPDLRGFGWSQAPARGYDAATFASDQIALLDALGLERAGIIGHDWGGFAAFLMAIAHPDRVERVMVLNAPHPWPPVSARAIAQMWRTWYVGLLASPLGERALRAGRLLPRVLRRGGRDAVFSGADAAIYEQRLLEPERAHATSLLYRSCLASAGRTIGGGPLRDARLTVPALLLFGTDDAFIPAAWLAGHEEHADDMRVELVPGCGHFVPEERPDLVADRALAFFG